MSSKEYLSFTKKERSGIIMLVIIVLIVAVVPKYLFPEKRLAAKIEKQQEEKVAYAPAATGATQTVNRFSNPPHKSSYPPTRPRQHPLRVININEADTTVFIALPGIGSKLASRIVLFREKLGGFYSVDQIREVYGLQDSVFQMIRPALRCDASAMKKININSASKEELKTHPYIRWNLANVLIQYRTMHGPFGSVEDLRKIENLDSAVIAKMKPYLSFDPNHNN